MSRNIRVEKKTYVKYGLSVLGFTLLGAFLGLLSGIFMSHGGGNVERAAIGFVALLQRGLLPLLAVVTVVSVLLGEWSLGRMRKLGNNMAEALDEEGDLLDYEMEKIGAQGLIANVASQVICMLVLSVGYSFEYMDRADSTANQMLWACLVFLACYIYDGFWQVRYVRVIQKTDPNKKGDPSSRKFQKQWLESCDEAEREIIYRSSYGTYMMVSKCIPVLMAVTMITHLLFNTGLMAIAVVGVIWMIMTVSYVHSCVKLQKSRALR